MAGALAELTEVSSKGTGIKWMDEMSFALNEVWNVDFMQRCKNKKLHVHFSAPKGINYSQTLGSTEYTTLREENETHFPSFPCPFVI